ncbi:MAG: response regulator [Oscillospiraceae bacterium]|nr:response regulator [Oscillospiraceae bacterium]
MGYKLLIYGKSPAAMKDFFFQTRNSFKCLSTTNLKEDILTHIEVFAPDGFLLFCEPADDSMVAQLKMLKSNPDYKNIPIFITGESGVCESFEKKATGMIALTLRKPTSAPIMEQQINRFLAANPGTKKPDKPGDSKTTLNVSLDDLMRSFGDTPPSDPNKRRHILVVDDDRSILKLLKTALSDDYDVTAMVSGNMAMKFLETKTADLILLDYEMPIENGAEVFKKLRADKRFADIPVVFLTGVADSSRIKEVLMLKPQGYLLKPISMDRLMSSIKGILK